jgi:hypothetical protein
MAKPPPSRKIKLHGNFRSIKCHTIKDLLGSDGTLPERNNI